MKALSIMQPWAWLILHGGKDIENRTWRTEQRGRILLHAGQRTDLDAFDAYRDLLPSLDKLPRGGIVGMVTITGCVRHSLSPWFNGPFGFTLKDAKELPFRAYRGQLGFFEVPDADPT